MSPLEMILIKIRTFRVALQLFTRLTTTLFALHIANIHKDLLSKESDFGERELLQNHVGEIR